MTSYSSAIMGPYQSMNIPLHRVRPYRDSDDAFITVSWIAEAIRSPTFSCLDRELAFGLLRPHVQALIKRMRHCIFVVVPSESNEPIEAWSVVDVTREIPIVYALHVKGPFRGQGLMTDLLKIQGIEPGSRIIAATDTRDLRGVMAKGLYDIHLRTELLLIEEKA